MDEKAKSVITTLGVAFALGMLGDALLRALPWGVNATIWVMVFALVVLKMPAGLSTALPGDRKAFLLLAAVFGICLAWRDSPTLRMLNIVALGSVFLACVLPDAVRRLREVTLTHWAQAAGDAIENLMAGLPRLVRKDVPLREVILTSTPGEEEPLWIKHGPGALAGILIAVPLVLLFGALFVSADAAFRVSVNNLFNLRWDTLFSHLFVTTLCTWLVAGYLRLLVFKTGQKWPDRGAIEDMQVNGMTLGIPLLSLDMLFLSFVIVQSRYMFGGEALIQAQTGLTFSSYARQGFFQLVTVALLALLFLLTVDWLGEGIGQGGRRVLRAMMAAMVALVYVVLASALYRMHLYQAEYGFTELRVYTTAFMLWLAVVLLWFLATVLPGKRERFALGALLTGLAVILGLHVFNPDANIVRWNAARVAEGKRFDTRYATSLSADAVPALVKALPSLREDERNTVRIHLRRFAVASSNDNKVPQKPSTNENKPLNQNKWAGRVRIPETAPLGPQGDWRTWNWSRYRAQHAVADL